MAIRAVCYSTSRVPLLAAIDRRPERRRDTLSVDHLFVGDLVHEPLMHSYLTPGPAFKLVFDHIEIRFLRSDDFEEKLDLVGFGPPFGLLTRGCGRS